MTSFSIQNFGCRTNQAEAFAWADEFGQHGLEFEKDCRRADLILVNTCTLTSRADRDVRKFIRRISRTNPEAKLVVTGCSVETIAEELKTFPHIWHLFPNREKKDLVEKVLTSFDRHEGARVSPFRSRALLKIQDGCNFQCTFCVIPLVRGKSVSYKKEDILSQVKKYIDRGFQEIVLTGIHLCSYGHDLKPRESLISLLEEIEKLEGLGSVRLSSLDPRFLTKALLRHLVRSAKICPHFHLSLQHGSDRVLERMGRKRKVKDCQAILTYLRQKCPSASLGADIIVGFPGESEEDFKLTFDFLEKSPLTYFHVFPYSPRPGTAAFNWAQVEEKTKAQRAALLRRLSAEKSLNFRRGFEGKFCQAIVVEKEDGRIKVLTSNYFKVFVPSCSKREGEKVRVRISKASMGATLGQIVD